MALEGFTIGGTAKPSATAPAAPSTGGTALKGFSIGAASAPAPAPTALKGFTELKNATLDTSGSKIAENLSPSPAPAIAPPKAADTSNIFQKFLGAIGSAAGKVGDALNRTITPPSQKDLGTNTTANTLKSLPSELARQIPGVAELQDDPSVTDHLDNSDFVKAIPAAVGQTAQGLIKAPITALADVWDAGRTFLGKNPNASFEVPGLGKVTSNQFDVADQIRQGADPVATVLSAGSASIFNTLFFADIVNRVSSARPVITSKTSGDFNDLPKTGDDYRAPVDNGPKSGRLYEAPTAYNKGGAQVLPPEAIAKMKTQGVEFGDKFDPTLPTFFRVVGGKGGSFTAEVGQLKPSYLEAAYSKLFGKPAPSETLPGMLGAGNAPMPTPQELAPIIEKATPADITTIHTETVKGNDLVKSVNEKVKSTPVPEQKAPALPPAQPTTSHVVAHNALRLTGGDTKQAKNTASILLKETKASIAKHGEDITLHALIGQIGMSPDHAAALIKEANIPTNSAEIQAVHERVLAPIREQQTSEARANITKSISEKVVPSQKDVETVYYNEVIEPAVKNNTTLVLDPDNIRKYFDDYSEENRPTYSKANMALLERAITEHPGSNFAAVGGGSGSGKSEFITKSLVESKYNGVVYDATQSSPELTLRLMEKAKEAGKTPEAFFIISDPSDARYWTMVREAETGRPVSHDAFVKIHSSYPKTILTLAENGINVQAIDARGLSANEVKAKIAAGKFESNPVDTINKMDYSEDNVRARTLYTENYYGKQNTENDTGQSKVSENDVGERASALQENRGSQSGDGKENGPEIQPAGKVKQGRGIPVAHGFISPSKMADDVAAGVNHLKEIIEHHQEVDAIVDEISNSIYKEEGANKVLKVRLANLVNDARKLSTPKEREHVYHYMEDNSYPLTKNEQEKVLPLVQAMDTTLENLRAKAREDGIHITGDILGEHTPRNAMEKGGVIDKAIDAYKAGKQLISNGPKLTTSVGSGSKSRVYRSLTDEKGNRTVAAIKKGKVTQIVKGKGKDLGTLKLAKNEELLNNEIRPLQRKISSFQKEIDTLESVKASSTGIEGKLKNLEEQALSISVSFLDTPQVRNDAGIAKDTKRLKALMHDINLLSKVKDGEDIILRNQRIETLRGKMVEASNAMAAIEAHYNPNNLTDKVFLGDDGKKYKLGQATTIEIESNTKTQYYKDPLANYALAIERTARAVRANELLTKIKESEKFKDAIKKVGEDNIPADFKSTRLDQMRGYMMEPQLAEAFDDFAKRSQGGVYVPIYDEINNLLISALVINPIMHFPNVAIGWGAATAAAGVVPEVDFMQTFKSVLNKDAEYLTWVEHGAPFQYLRQTNAEFADAMLGDIVADIKREPTRWEELSKQLGHANPLEWAHALEKLSSDSTWVANDVMLFNALKTYQKAYNSSYEKAIEEVSKRMANYRVPPRVLGSRAFSLALQNNAAFMFMRFHYSGVIKPWVASTYDSAAGDKDQRYSGLRTLAYFAMMWFIYQLADKGLEKLTGNPDTYLSMAGPMRLSQNVVKSFQTGSPIPVLASTFSLTPSIKIIGAILTGYDFTNFFKPVYGPGGEGALTFFKNQAAPYNAIEGAFTGVNSWSDFALAQGGVYSPQSTPSQGTLNAMLNVEKPQVEAAMKKDIAAGDTAGATAAAHDFNTRLKTVIKNADISNGNSGSDARVDYFFQTFPNGLGQKGYAVRLPTAKSLANYEAKQGLQTDQKVLPGPNNITTSKGKPSDITNHTDPGTIKAVVNGVTIYNRMTNEGAVKKQLEGGTIIPDTIVDHIVPLEGGGGNNVDNLEIISTYQNNINYAVENFIGREIQAGRMTGAQAREIAIRFKGGLGLPLSPALSQEYKDKYKGQSLNLDQVQDYKNTVSQ